MRRIAFFTTVISAIMLTSNGENDSKDEVSDRALDRYGYDTMASASSYGGGGCCGGKNDLLPLLALAGLSLLLIYLITAALTTTGGRKRRNVDDNRIVDEEDITLDGPAWLSMIHELWEQDGVSDDPSCAYHTLCRMNRIAAESGGQGTWAAHLSSVPLSYLLHHRHHDSGFLGYLDAAMVGRSGANCTALFNGCSRLQ